jgi:hypothetical protein
MWDSLALAMVFQYSVRSTTDVMNKGFSKVRIGINSLYWIPNAMGGTQTYLLRLVEGLLEAAE